MNKRERRDLTKTVTCDCGCGKTFHPFKYKKYDRNFIDATHYSKYKKDNHIGGHTKLTPDKVREINSLKGHYLASELTGAYQVSPVTIEQIWNGLRWNHITHNK